MDLVYLGVDGADPAWRARMHATYERYAHLPWVPPPSPARYANHGELRYSLRSVVAHGEAFERIFLVTDGQVPAWLDVEARASDRWRGRLTLVHHSAIFPPGAARPCFSSDNIAVCATRIPGLARRFVIANDDVFLARPVAEDDFFDAQGRAVVRLCPIKLRRQADEGDPYYAQWLNAIALLERHGVRPPWARSFSARLKSLRRTLLGREVVSSFLAPQHTFHAVDRDVALEVWKRHAEPIEASLAVPFRSRRSVNPALLYFYEALARDQAVARMDGEGMIVSSSDADPGDLQAGLAHPRTKFLCLNECHRGAPPDWPARVQRLLDLLFPTPSPFEREARTAPVQPSPGPRP